MTHDRSPRARRAVAGLVALPLLLGAGLAGAQQVAPPAPPAPEAGGPPPAPGRDHGPGHGRHRDHDRDRDLTQADADRLRGVLAEAGYVDIRLVDLDDDDAEFAAADASGKLWLVDMDEDGRIEERSPYAEPPAPEAIRASAERLGYTEVGPAEARRHHVEFQARAADGRVVTVEMNPDGSLRKETYRD